MVKAPLHGIWPATTVLLALVSLAIMSRAQARDADIAALCDAVPVAYVYFADRAGHWDAACERAQRDASEGKRPHLAILEDLVDALYDPHANLGSNSATSPRLVPSGLDIRLKEEADGVIRIVGIRPGTTAAASGLGVGDVVVGIHGQPPMKAAMARIKVGPADLPGRLDWALNAAMAGYRGQDRSITVKRSEAPFQVSLGDPEPPAPEEFVISRWVADGIGYLRFENSLGDDATVPAFFEALKVYENAEGLIVDLRNTPGGGNTGVAEPILSAFISKRMAYQMTVPRGGDPEPRFAGPAAGAPFAGRVIVLVGYWTGSMGEGLAIGFDATGAGVVMGSPMAKLAGGTESVTLPESGINVWLPAYDLTHMDGTPRHEWAPSPVTTADDGDGTDLLLDAAVAALRE